VKSGELAPCEYLNVESEFAAMSVLINASAAGARTYTATASQGLLYMAEALYNTSGLGLPIVACFDTAFHHDLPAAAATYALPRDWKRRWGLRRYGFNGLSHAYAARQAVTLTGRDDLRIVTCHLGSGASLAAVSGGRSVDTTMGFTPLAGLVMATRSGSLDPGLLLWLLRHGEPDVDRLSDVLEHESGLAGLNGGTGDMREVVRNAEAGDADATRAFDVYIHRLRREIAGMAAAMDGLGSRMSEPCHLGLDFIPTRAKSLPYRASAPRENGTISHAKDTWRCRRSICCLALHLCAPSACRHGQRDDRDGAWRAAAGGDYGGSSVWTWCCCRRCRSGPSGTRISCRGRHGSSSG
jgi:hypothetical protein